MNWLKRIFTGPTFWAFNSIINFILAIVAIVVGSDPMSAFIVMWISLATYEILKQLETRKEPDAV